MSYTRVTLTRIALEPLLYHCAALTLLAPLVSYIRIALTRSAIACATAASFQNGDF